MMISKMKKIVQDGLGKNISTMQGLTKVNCEGPCKVKKIPDIFWIKLAPPKK